ncbi:MULTISPECIES: carbohydrate ABC transporter permease [Rhodococcus]|uniref:Carbohydrate ABC transporter permease n=1 Tax=Rhodococcus oxybenzonivorans TaxID=1990687 RepID=A0A2S2C3Z0_9NOCA|nr:MULTISPECIES: carbohydrate ABC transporter permease [Rhodococcus]AWK75579.1 sugar ABC transporter permease [Rhodococcus oxybenzonivorans]MDV7242471.1 carbohydrate ABC transporter permease [Rhodococcus oxybenzonivorans]MDV7267818.1 carbohydrate ABC transporter permease [Rhodococcus oxybenzonivorans]MDV7277218.1 carbohydrate ABC transporter permease [Rhodococcus oxybenzonivorans]MDV7331960.1 carbohydrate ABC transporter permease [Rhodococcus oxybenzonivorans]
MKTSVRERIPGLVLLFGTMIFSILPLLSMLTAALQPQGTVPLGLSWPANPQWHNFLDAWRVAEVTPLLVSSIILVAGVVPVAALFAAMAGYALGQLKIPGGTVVFLLLLLGLTLPKEATIVPLYYQLREMNLLNTRLGLILVLIGTFMPFAVFWMRAHFLSMPKELTEAADLDGAGPWQAFRHIQIPLAVPALASLCLLLFLWTWNTFLQAIVLIDDPSKRTMAGALQNFVGQYSTDVVLLNAGSLLIMAPTVVVFLLFQRHFVKAMIAGAVKG